MSTLLNYCGEDELYLGRSFYSNSMAPKDIHGPPRKRSRISTPFSLWGSESDERKGALSINVLPDECIFEILRRLPAQERSICACVSKHWLTLMSSTRSAELCDNNDTQDDGLVTKSLEGKRATDIRLAAIAVKVASQGGLEKLSIRGSNSTRRVTNFGISAIARGSSSLKSLSLWNVSFVGDEGLIEVANECRMLERLDLCQCPLITNKGLVAIAKKCPNLSALLIESCPNIGNDCLQAIGRGCPKLELVSLKDCPLVGDQGIANLLHSGSSLVLSRLRLQRLNISGFSLAVISHYGQSLTSLTLSNLGNVNERGFWAIGEVQGLKSLVSLSITSCPGLTDLGLEAIAKGCPILKQISIRNSSIVSDNGLVAFSKSTESLESLHLEDCNWVTLYGVISALSNLSSKLKSLSLVKCMSLKDMPFQEISKTLCQTLRTLSIKNCPGFGSLSLAILAKMCPNLKQVDLIGLYGMTDAGILSFLGNCFWGLVKVNLSGCINLSDESILGIARLHGETLKELNLDGCRKITDLSLSAIAKSCSILHDLDVSNCAITDSGIVGLACSEDLNLQILSISGCSKVSNKSLPFLIKLGQNLIGMNLKHCSSLSPKCIDTIVCNLWRCDILW